MACCQKGFMGSCQILLQRQINLGYLRCKQINSLRPYHDHVCMKLTTYSSAPRRILESNVKNNKVNSGRPCSARNSTNYYAMKNRPSRPSLISHNGAPKQNNFSWKMLTKFVCASTVIGGAYCGTVLCYSASKGRWPLNIIISHISIFMIITCYTYRSGCRAQRVHTGDIFLQNCCTTGIFGCVKSDGRDRVWSYKIV